MQRGELGDVRLSELESSSSGGVLEPGQALSHEQQTFHFVGEEAALDAIATHVLGISLATIGSPTHAAPPAPSR